MTVDLSLDNKVAMGGLTLDFSPELWDTAFAMPAEGVYGITKLAVIGLTTNLARELGPSNITVNCIAPGLPQSEAAKLLTPGDSPYVEARWGALPCI